MPPLGEEEYLINLWQEAGAVSSNGMGMTSLSWLEIEAWLNTLEVELDIWEKLLIKRLSTEYANEFALSSDPKRSAPFSEMPDEEARVFVGNKIKNVLGMFKKPSGNEPRYTVEERQ